MKYTEDQRKQMAERVLSARGTQQYRDFMNLMEFLTGMAQWEIVGRIEHMAKGKGD